jgi:peptidoglycan/LPS O-acetylase OafA/YrhL
VITKSEPETRISVLDGARGLAIWLVMLVHFTPDYLMPNRPLEWIKKLIQTGWTGVDLFFVLSGMLITEVLLRSIGTAHPAKNFYMRRFLRIMPLYLGSLVFVFGILPWIVRPGMDPHFDAMQTVQGWYWVQCANIIALLHGFPGLMISPTVNLAHFWTLAVEEHFYLLWPLLVWKLDEGKLIKVAVAVIVAALVFRLVFLMFPAVNTLHGMRVQTPAHMDALAFGTLAALLLRRGHVARLRRCSWWGFLVTVSMLGIYFYIRKGLWFSDTFITGIGFTVIAMAYCCGVLLLRTGEPSSIMVRLVDNAFLRFFGKYSYGLYILHGMAMPLLNRLFPAELLLAEFHNPVLASLAAIAIKVSLSLIAALLSWHLVEQPCLKLKHKFEYV